MKLRQCCIHPVYRDSLTSIYIKKRDSECVIVCVCVCECVCVCACACACACACVCVRVCVCEEIVAAPSSVMV